MTKKSFLATAGAVILLMIIGSFADFQISSALFNTSSVFGNIFAAYGELPLGVFMLVPIYILLFCHEGQKTVGKVFSILGGILMLGGSLYFLLFNPTRYLRQYIWPNTSGLHVAAIGVLIIAGIGFGMTRYTKGIDHRDLRRLALVCFLMVVSAIVVINVIKSPWGRPRMRLIAINDLAKFQPWWVIGGAQKEVLLAAGVASDELKSFPSGHTADAALMLCLSFMALTKKKYEKDKAMFYSGCAFAAVVAFSRIIMGAHFLSDVTFGFGTTFVLYLVFRRIFYGPTQRNPREELESSQSI